MQSINRKKSYLKNFSHIFSKGGIPAVKNINAIFGCSSGLGRSERKSCEITRMASYSSV